MDVPASVWGEIVVLLSSLTALAVAVTGYIKVHKDERNGAQRIKNGERRLDYLEAEVARLEAEVTRLKGQLQRTDDHLAQVLVEKNQLVNENLDLHHELHELRKSSDGG